jgi:anti-sigma-K factor RskA
MSETPRQLWDDASVGEYALGVMPHRERLRFAADLKADRALQARLAVWEENVAPMVGELAEVSPPPQVFSKIEERLFPTVQSTSKQASIFQRLGFWQAAAALGFAAFALMVAMPRFAAPPVETAPLVAVIQGETLLVSASYDVENGILNISRKRGAEGVARDFELWVIASDGIPVSLGVLEEGEATLVNVPDAFKAAFAGATLAISDEPDGGSPTGKPTGTILGTGTVVEI